MSPTADCLILGAEMNHVVNSPFMFIPQILCSPHKRGIKRERI